MSSIRFTKHRSEFQKLLSRDIKEVKKSKSIFVPADKTTNIYKLSPDSYKKLLHENVTSKYKKASAEVKATIDREAKSIASRLKLDERIECMAESPAFVSLKDHKDNFENNPKCRLLNPSKTEIGMVARKHLQAVNESIRSETGLLQWRNTQTVLDWFKQIPLKKQSHFIQLDIVDFYPSISEELLMKSIEYAQTITDVSAHTIEIIMHSRKSLLFNDGVAWIKKDGSLFDVTMGSYDGAEVCELVGLFLLHKMKTSFPQIDFGLYRDDGLGCYKKKPGPQVERIRKDIIKLFKDHGLAITIIMNGSVANFLDVSLNLGTGKYSPYRKPNDTPLYINKSSNHPPNIINQLPKMVQKRLSDLSSDSQEFDKAKDVYNNALQSSGFSEVTFSRSTTTSSRKRKRNIIWFNPPFNQAVQTNIGREFTRLIEKHFPPHHKYRKIFNKSNLRLSYSCMPNVKTVISSHNKRILSTPAEHEERLCNCRDKDNCPLNGECLVPAVTYRAHVSTDANSKERQYTGVTEPPWKQRFRNHKSSFSNAEKRTESCLSKYVWKCKDEGLEPIIRWSIVSRSYPYRCGSRKCDLCLTEKLSILRSVSTDPESTLNSRSELLNKCRHSLKFKLRSVR